MSCCDGSKVPQWVGMMPTFELTEFDVAARFGARLNGVDFLELNSQVDFAIRFDRWIDSRTQASREAQWESLEGIKPLQMRNSDSGYQLWQNLA
jgi:hypothetical protein